MPSPVLSGFLYDSVGTPVSGATVETYKRNDTVTALSSTTTNASGYWTITESTADGMWVDIQITNGTEITRFKYDDEVQFKSADVQKLVQRNSSAESSFGITFDVGTLAGDQTHTWPSMSDSDQTVLLSGHFTNDSDVIWGTGVTKYKTADQSFTSSALANDTHLQIALASGQWYRVHAGINADAAGASGDLWAYWNVPVGANLQGVWFSGAAAGTTVRTAPVTEASTAAIINNASAAQVGAIFDGYLESSAQSGTLILQFRQDQADDSATTVHEGSWISATRISS